MSPGARFKRALVGGMHRHVLHSEYVCIVVYASPVRGDTIAPAQCRGTRPCKIHTTVNIVPRVFRMWLDMVPDLENDTRRSHN